MKNARRLLTILIALSLVIASVPLNNSSHAATALKLGDYIQFGSYASKPITWRVIDFDQAGNPLLFSSKVISTKAFDADHLDDVTKDFEYGSGNWKDSNIRAWLNSSAKAGSVVYPCGNPPTADRLKTEWDDHPYDQEAGFLSAQNFTPAELEYIKSVTQKSLLSNYFKSRAEGGTGALSATVGDDTYLTIDQAISNFATAYYETVTDRVFFLDLDQYKNVVDRFGNFYLGYSTTNLDGYGEKQTNGLYLYDYFLRVSDSKYADLPFFAWSYVRAVYPTEMKASLNGNAAHYESGIRPGLYLDASMIQISSGSGTESKPYVLKGTPVASKSNINVTIDGKYVSFNDNLGYPFVDTSNRTQVPLRVTMEAYGAKVDFDARTSTAIVTKDGVTVKVPIGKKYIYKGSELIPIDTAAIVKNGRTYLPIRAVVEALAGQVSWDSANYKVVIQDLFTMIRTTAAQVDANPYDSAIVPDKVIKIAADPRKGFNYDYLLYIPTNTPKGKETTLIVETMNGPGPNKNAQEAVDQAYYVLKRPGIMTIAGDLGIPLIVPCIERPYENQAFYSYGFDRDTLLIKNNRYARIDLQVANMIKDAQKVLAASSYPVDDKVFFWGFSGSGQFAHRFTVLYPEMVKASAGGGNSKMTLPITNLNGNDLIFPIGISDVKKIAGIDFNASAYSKVPQFVFLGDKDGLTDDDVYYADSYSPEEQALIFKVYGKGYAPFYWQKTQELNQPYAPQIQYKTYPGLEHTYDEKVLKDITEFFRKYL